MRVTIPADATVSWAINENPDLTVEGAGLFPGVVLAADVPGRDGPLLLAGRAPADALCSVADCLGTEYVVSSMETVYQPTARYLVPAGSYLLYLLAYGSPVSVTLTLQGLEGTTEISPGGPAHLSSHLMAPRLAIPAQAVYWDGAFRTMEGPGLVLVWSALVSRYLLIDEMDHCFYSEAPAPPTAYMPLCQGADYNYSWGWAKVSTGVLRHEMFSLSYPVPEGGSGVGYWDMATHPVDRTTALALWLTFA